MPLTEAETWEQRYLLEAQRYARLLLSVTEREIEIFEQRTAEREAVRAAAKPSVVLPDGTLGAPKDG